MRLAQIFQWDIDFRAGHTSHEFFAVDETIITATRWLWVIFWLPGLLIKARAHSRALYDETALRIFRSQRPQHAQGLLVEQSVDFSRIVEAQYARKHPLHNDQTTS